MKYYLDTSEAKSNSLTLKNIDVAQFTIVTGPEKSTGADLIISPVDNYPSPITRTLAKKHIVEGASLVQIKFGQDMIASILDGRINEAIDRMLSLGAMTWQCIILEIGIFSEKDGKLLINKSPSYGIKEYRNYLIAKQMYIKRGVIVINISGGRYLTSWIEAEAKAIRNSLDRPVEAVYPFSPPFYEEDISPREKDIKGMTPEEYENTINDKVLNPLLREWDQMQKLQIVNDIRLTWRTIPGIGDELATRIYNYLGSGDQPQNWYGFQNIIENGDILRIEGVGKGKLKKITDWLQGEI